MFEKIDLQFCKRILKLKSSTPNFMIYGELGRFPINIYVVKRMIAFWLKLADSDCKLSNMFYRLMLELNEVESCWILHIKNLLNNLGFCNVWILQRRNIHRNWLINAIERRLKDNYIQNWYSQVYSSSKSKVNFEFEQYFDILLENLRNILVKFRTCNHRLPIEKGRWKNVERNNRICNLCNNSSIGDEFHF